MTWIETSVRPEVLADFEAAINRILEKEFVLEDPTPEELALDDEAAEAIRGPLEDSYTRPVAEDDGNLAELVGEAVAVIVAFLLSLYRGIFASVIQAFKDELYIYLLRYFELGGQAALDDLGIDAEFILRDPDILAFITAWIDDVLTDGGEYDLFATTAEDLASKIKDLDKQGFSWELMIPLLIAYGIARASTRAPLIASNEGVRMSRAALLTTFERNGVDLVIYQTAGDEKVCPICLPYDNRVMTHGEAVSLIPQHGSCRCGWSPVVDGWEAPENPWTGG